IHPRDRDDVARKSSLYNLPVDILLRPRIVDRAFQNRVAQRIGAERAASESPREVARAICRGRHGDGDIVDNEGFAVLLAIEEEEGPVLALVELRYPHRTADIKAVIVAPDALYVIDERSGCVKKLIRQIIVPRAVILIRAGPHREVNQAAADGAKLCGEVTGLDGGFL